MKIKKTKEQYFVQLGLKRNGRIVKNEQYSLDEFLEDLSLFPDVTVVKPKLPKLVNLLLKFDWFRGWLFDFVNWQVKDYILNGCDFILRSKVNKDGFGKKRK